MNNLGFYTLMIATGLTATLAMLGGSVLQVVAPMGVWAAAAGFGILG